MVRARINIDPYREEIQEMLLEGKSLKQIRLDLLERHDIQIKKTTLQRRVLDWNLVQSDAFDQLDDHVQNHFWRGLDDDEIAATFQVVYNTTVSTRTVRRSRIKQDLVRRMNPFARKEYMQHVKEYLSHVITTSKISRYGIRSVQEHLRSQQILATR